MRGKAAEGHRKTLRAIFYDLLVREAFWTAPALGSFVKAAVSA